MFSILTIPFPTQRLASFVLRTLQVDAELSPLVKRTFSLTTLESSLGDSITKSTFSPQPTKFSKVAGRDRNEELVSTVLITEYKATTNRMLRVAVNGFMESLVLVLGVMKELDVDVLGGGDECATGS